MASSAAGRPNPTHTRHVAWCPDDSRSRPCLSSGPDGTGRPAIPRWWTGPHARPVARSTEGPPLTRWHGGRAGVAVTRTTASPTSASPIASAATGRTSWRSAERSSCRAAVVTRAAAASPPVSSSAALDRRQDAHGGLQGMAGQGPRTWRQHSVASRDRPGQNDTIRSDLRPVACASDARAHALSGS